MKIDFSELTVTSNDEISKKAAELFCEEIKLRLGFEPKINPKFESKCELKLIISEQNSNESFSIVQTENCVAVFAHRLRGLIYGYSVFLRKSVIENNRIFLIKNISGDYTPSMKIRGHQLGYTDMSNTYETWSEKQFRRYFLELMYFGTNTIEATAPKDKEPTKLMQYSFEEITDIMSQLCNEFDLNFSIWNPLSKKLDDKQEIDKICTSLKNISKLDILFLPGGDPGDLQAESFIDRCRLIKNELIKKFPNIQIWPSAQAPHEYPDWGKRLKNKMLELPEEIDGLIYGPNHAMPLDEMRRSIDSKYQIRFYPDICHNVRCEIPVHFNRDDWHYAWASTISREGINPRPVEYRLMHRITRQYVCGSVTYSEGVNDDVNKAVWSSMDFDFNSSLRETLCDYSRLFFYGADYNRVADAIFGLELNWEGDPAENSSVQNTYNIFSELKNSQPILMNSWRFLLLVFRSICDKILRDRRIFELDLVDRAKCEIRNNNLEKAKIILQTEYSEEYIKLREELFVLAKKLFKLIGIQLDVNNFGGMNWERGCTLDTIDMPITDRKYLLNKIESNSSASFLKKIINRNIVDTDEYYFSFAEHGFDICGKQDGEYYMDFEGDNNADGLLPMCMLKTYDHFIFKTKIAGLTGGDYKLRITYKNRTNASANHHKIIINGNVIYNGKPFGGVRDKDYEKMFLTENYQCIAYNIDKKYFINGCAEIEISEPVRGFLFCEFSLKKA